MLDDLNTIHFDSTALNVAGRPAPSAPAAGPPVRFGAYEVHGLLGKGRLGGVCRALHVGLNREAALKFLHPHVAKIPACRAQFLAEARCMAALDHPNLLPVYDVGEAGGRVYVAMKLMQGDMEQYVKNAGPLSSALTLKLVYHLAGGLAELHGRGLIHRDVKPGNVFFDRKSIVLGDFGLVFDPIEEEGSSSRFVGTPGYMAPELIRNRPCDQRMDVYALGATAFYFLTGRRPFDGADIPTILDRVVNAPTPLVRDHNPSVRPELAELVRRMMDKDPAQRPESAQAVRGLAQRAFDRVHAAEAGPASSAKGGWLASLMGRSPAASAAPASASSLSQPPAFGAASSPAVSTAGKVASPPAAPSSTPAASVAGAADKKVHPHRVHPEDGRLAPAGMKWQRAAYRGQTTWQLVRDAEQLAGPQKGK